MQKNHATAARTDPEIEIPSDDVALPVGAEASGPSLGLPSSGDMFGVGAGGDEGEGESDELEGPSDELVGPSDELVGPPELESGLGDGVLADEDVGDFAGAPPPEDGEALGVEVVFFLAAVGAEAVGGEVGAEAVGFGDPAAACFEDPAAACFGDAAAAGEGVGELLLPLALGAPAGVGGSAAKTAVMASTATARDRSVKVLVIFM